MEIGVVVEAMQRREIDITTVWFIHQLYMAER